jgi:GPH family glycoside/pentoside/hexuronide:cation symporter
MTTRTIRSAFGLLLAATLLPTLAAAAKPFKVLCYSAYRDGQSPGGAQPTDAQIEEDLRMLLPYTYGIRIYSLGGHSARIPAMADKLGMEVHVGIWIDDNDAANQAAVDEGIALLKQGHPSIKSVIVGNEYLLRQEVTFNRNLAAAETKLIGYIDQVKKAVPNLPVGTAEPYWWWIKTSRALWEKCDIIYWQVHPWWDNQSIQGSVGFVTNLHNQVRAKIASFNLTNPNKRDIISETGWPTAVNRGAAVGSVANQQTFVKNLHAWAYPANMEYWFFCPFDENWKDEAGGVGSVWGIWNADRSPKATASNLNTLIPENLRYTSGWGPVGIRPIARNPGLRILPAGVEVRDFNALGKAYGPSSEAFGAVRLQVTPKR